MIESKIFKINHNDVPKNFCHISLKKCELFWCVCFFIVAFCAKEQAHIIELFFGEYQRSNMPARRQNQVQSIKMIISACSAFADSDIDTKLQHHKARLDELLAKFCAAFPVFFCACWQIKHHEHSHKLLFHLICSPQKWVILIWILPPVHAPSFAHLLRLHDLGDISCYQAKYLYLKYLLI